MKPEFWEKFKDGMEVYNKNFELEDVIEAKLCGIDRDFTGKFNTSNNKIVVCKNKLGIFEVFKKFLDFNVQI